LYNDETVADIHIRKKLKPKEKILDFMNSHELIANLFRISQAEEKIRIESIEGVDEATYAHLEVGKAVRKAIFETSGVMPENQPTPKIGITDLEKQQIQALKNKKKMLDE